MAPQVPSLPVGHLGDRGRGPGCSSGLGRAAAQHHGAEDLLGLGVSVPGDAAWQLRPWWVYEVPLELVEVS